MKFVWFSYHVHIRSYVLVAMMIMRGRPSPTAHVVASRSKKESVCMVQPLNTTALEWLEALLCLVQQDLQQNKTVPFLLQFQSLGLAGFVTFSALGTCGGCIYSVSINKLLLSQVFSSSAPAMPITWGIKLML